MYSTVFQGILAFRQQHDQPGAFGRSDLYFICHMKPLTFEINACPHEIAACEWMCLSDFLSNGNNSAITQRIVQLVAIGLIQGFNTVDLSPESVKSVYKGLKYDLFSRVLPDGSKLTNYAHNLTDVKGMDTELWWWCAIILYFRIINILYVETSF